MSKQQFKKAIHSIDPADYDGGYGVWVTESGEDEPGHKRCLVAEAWWKIPKDKRRTGINVDEVVEVADYYSIPVELVDDIFSELADEPYYYDLEAALELADKLIEEEG